MRYFKLLLDFLKLRRNIKKPRSKLENIQKEKLYSILQYAYDNSEYYRKSFNDAGIKKENILSYQMSDFPSIDKKNLLENFNKVVTVDDLKQEELIKFDEEESLEERLFLGKYHIVHSSGSTGKPGYFVYDESAWNQMLIGIIRGALWDMTTQEIIKLLIKRPKIVYIAATDGRYGGAMAVGSGIEGLHMEQIFLDINTPLNEWVKSIHEFSPNIVIGYPSAIKILGELIEKGELKADFIRVISCGEPLGNNLRNYLERIFKSNVINIYGASESLALGVESSLSNGMYLFDDMNYIEVENGVMYLTSLYNKVQPLIRYKISDKLVLKELDGKIPFTVVESIVGRSEDLLWFEDKDGNREFIHPLSIEGFCIEGLVDYQFKQVSKERFEMIAEVPNDRLWNNIEKEMKENLNNILKEKRLDYVEFNISFTEYIKANQLTGKKQLIIR